mgnify:CR=1 FL=1
MHFEKPGTANTETAAALALKIAAERNIRHIVAASVTGETARILAKAEGIDVVCVNHVNGFCEPGQNEMSQEVRKSLEEQGIKVLTTTHVLSGAERGISRFAGGMYPVEAIANALRMLGQGTKVCVEIAVMALDAGLIPFGEPVIAVGGTGRGADTAVIITPYHASDVFKTKIHEIICKPSLYPKQ